MSADCAVDISQFQTAICMLGPDFASKLVAAFHRDMARMFTELPLALRESRHKDVMRIGHSIKSLSLSLGAARLSELAKIMEHSAAQANMQSMDTLFQQLQDEYKRVDVALEEIVRIEAAKPIST